MSDDIKYVLITDGNGKTWSSFAYGKLIYMRFASLSDPQSTFIMAAFLTANEYSEEELLGYQNAASVLKLSELAEIFDRMVVLLKGDDHYYKHLIAVLKTLVFGHLIKEIKEL